MITNKWNFCSSIDVNKKKSFSFRAYTEIIQYVLHVFMVQDHPRRPKGRELVAGEMRIFFAYITHPPLNASKKTDDGLKFRDGPLIP